MPARSASRHDRHTVCLTKRSMQSVCVRVYDACSRLTLTCLSFFSDFFVHVFVFTLSQATQKQAYLASSTLRRAVLMIIKRHGILSA